MNLVFLSDDPAIAYAPSSGWAGIAAPGAMSSYNGQFLLSNDNQGVVTLTFPTAGTAFEFWGWQRSDGGMYSLTVDGGAAVQVDYYNQTSTGNDSPVQLYSTSGLSNDVHTVVITNTLDSRVNKYGQMNIDHFVVNGIPPQATPPTFPAGSWIAEAPLEFSYHVSISLGADATVNGGNGSDVKVLLDTGATGAWVIWAGCTESQCQGHNDYHPSANNFQNTTQQDTAVYGSGGPANTLGSWRVTDTVTFGNATILSTDFGATFEVPQGGEGLDGNFGMAKAYCGGQQLCGVYPGFVENMFAGGDISAPVLAFYQLAPNDQPPSGVNSIAQIGGVDRAKYTGNIDWAPLSTDSMWEIPNRQTWVSDGKGNSQEATDTFRHPKLTFDTGDPGLLGLPTDDWVAMMGMLGAQGPDGNGNYLIPCNSTMTWDFHGTMGANYTFNLADTTSDNGSGFCNPSANDAGSTTNWITGAPFLDQYYVAFYYGDKGDGATLGFATKNLDASAANTVPVVGSA